MGDKIKTADDVQKFADDTELKLEEVSTSLEEQAAKNQELTEALEKATADGAALIEKIKDLEIAVKAKGSWKEQDTEVAKVYGLGKFAQALFEQKFGASRKALEKLGEMGSRYIPRGAHEKEIDITKAGLSSSPLTGDDSVGSYLGSYTVPVEYNAEILRIAADASAMMGRVRQVPVPAITSYYPTTVDALTFTKLTNQNTDKTEDNVTFGRATLTTEIYAAYVAVVEEFEEDSLIAIGTLLRDMFGEAWGTKFDDLALTDSTYGAMATTSIVEQLMDSSSFDDLSIDDMNEMVKNLDSRAKRRGGEYFIHPTVWDYIEDEKDADGNYKLRSPAEGAPLRLKGYPVVQSDGMPDSGDDAASTSFVAFGNPRHILSGTRVPFEFRVYDQTQSNMESGQVFFRCRVRQAMVLAIPTAWVKLTSGA